MRKVYVCGMLLCSLLMAGGCRKENPEIPESGSTADDLYYQNLFAYHIMDTYYLWVSDIQEGLSSWKTSEPDPVKKVESVRYPDDHWTALYTDASIFESAVSGDGSTYGAEFVLWNPRGTEDVNLLVLYTYADSPAAQAGLRRGDVFSTLNGSRMNMSNYKDVVNATFGGKSLTLSDGSRSVVLNAVSMYSNPVQTVRVLELDGQTIGYLHFTNFTLKAGEDLEKAFGSFKDAGIDRLVLDLRYNGGGYSATSVALGSMIAPLDDVNEGKLFTQDVYNDELGKYMGDNRFSYFSADCKLPLGAGTVHAAAVNSDLSEVWVITSGETASASEALICGLIPYMDVHLVGEQTYGKFCGGYLLRADEWYDAVGKNSDNGIDIAAGKKATEDWGLYVIASRYSDCNGVTLSMPVGIPVHYAAADNPLDGHELGDPDETMLAATLRAMGVSTKAPGPAAPAFTPLERPDVLVPAHAGLYIQSAGPIVANSK